MVCGDAMLLEVIELQVPNRKPISGKDFVNGMRIHPGEKFVRVADNEDKHSDGIRDGIQ